MRKIYIRDKYTTMAHQKEKEENSAKQYLFAFLCIIFVCVSLWLTFQRYKLLGTAVRNKDTMAMLALSSPEIGQGMGALLRGFL